MMKVVIKMTESNCKNCGNTCNKKETNNCKKYNLGFWCPDELTICHDCPMCRDCDGEQGCTRHAEPCLKNTNHYDLSDWEDFLNEYRLRFVK